MLGVKIGDKHTYKNWGLKWLEPYNIGLPAPKTYTIDLPGSDGKLDLTEALNGYVHYDNRQIELNFDCEDVDYYDFEHIRQEIANYIHGRYLKVVLDTDPQYFYEGRLFMETEKNSKAGSTIKITGDMDPYKYEEYSSLGEWLWDTFNFLTDDIRDCKNLVIKGERTVRILPTRKPCTPKITSSGDILMIFDGVTYQLHEGTVENPYVIFGDSVSVLKFVGNGVVSLDYQGGTL